MGWFGPPNVEKMTIRRDVQGLTRALRYRKSSAIRREAARALGRPPCFLLLVIPTTPGYMPVVVMFPDPACAGPVAEPVAFCGGWRREGGANTGTVIIPSTRVRFLEAARAAEPSDRRTP